MKKFNIIAALALVMMLAAALAGSGHAFAQGATPSVDANDQAAGSSLTVAKVVAAQDGWITVHANTADNKPGDQLGHTMVKAGENDNVVVQLSPAPKAGDKVWPMLHIDAGVIGTYEFPGPDAPVIIDGNIVMKQITLTAAAPSVTPSVDASDQPAGSSITVDNVVAAQDGWITVHANTADNKPGDQLGHTMVKAGANSKVVVQLNPVPKAGDKVWPMLHIDAGVIGTYEFPGPDAPVIIDGNIVMKQITLTGATFATGAPDSVSADDQPAGDTVVVKHIHANQDGFITIHANTAANQPGAQLGHAAVKMGDNENVVVQVSPATKAGDKVWPMLHIDAGVIGTYEFPGPDAPVIINGNIIMQEINITAASTSSNSGGSSTGGSSTVMPQMPTTGNSFDYTWLVALAALALMAGFSVRRLAVVRTRR